MLELCLEEKVWWNVLLVQAVQLNDNVIRSQRDQIEIIRDRIESKYKLGKRLAKIEFEKQEDYYIELIISLRKEVWKVAHVKASLSEKIKSLELAHKESIEKLEEEKKLLEVFNNQLCEQYKDQECVISSLYSEVQMLEERNYNLSKENSIKEERMNKMSRKLTLLTERATKSDTMMKEIDMKMEDLKARQDLLLPPKKRKSYAI